MTDGAVRLSTRVRHTSRRAAVALTTAVCALLLTSTTAFGQASTTATVRGTVQDPSGGVLPGATVTALNTGTKAVHTTVTDDRGQYLFAGLFPGAYDLKVELSGFKTYEQKGYRSVPSDNRGVDIRLEVGQQTETVTVTSQPEVIQTETGAREGVLTAKQIDNLSVIGRSSLELLRILPGVVATQPARSKRRLRRGRQQHAGLHGQRHPLLGQHRLARRLVADRHRQQQRRHRLAEQRHGAGGEGPRRNFAAENGTGGMNVSGVTKAGTSKFQRHALRLLARPPVRRQRPVEQHRRHGQAEEHVSVSRRQRRRSDHLPRRRTTRRTATRLFFFVGFEVPAPEGRLRARIHAHRLAGDARGDFSELLANRGAEPEQRARSSAFPEGFPGAGSRRRTTTFAPYITPLGQVLRRASYPLPNYNDPTNRYNYVYSALEPNEPLRLQVAVRLQHQQQHQGLRPHRPRG